MCIRDRNDAGDGRRGHTCRADVEEVGEERRLQYLHRLNLPDGHFYQLDAKMAQFEFVVRQVFVSDDEVIGTEIQEPEQENGDSD